MSEANIIPVESSDDDYDGNLWDQSKKLERNVTKLKKNLKLPCNYLGRCLQET